MLMQGGRTESEIFHVFVFLIFLFELCRCIAYLKSEKYWSASACKNLSWGKQSDPYHLLWLQSDSSVFPGWYFHAYPCRTELTVRRGTLKLAIEVWRGHWVSAHECGGAWRRSNQQVGAVPWSHAPARPGFPLRCSPIWRETASGS